MICDILSFLELDNFMNVLEERLLKKKPQSAGLVAKKVRRTGTSSSSTPPDNAPVWAIIKDTGMLTFALIHTSFIFLDHV